MDNRYNRHNRRKYSLKVHIVLVTKYRKQLRKDSIADDVKQKIFDIANTYGYEIVAIETDKDHIHFLLIYDTTDRVCDIVKIVKQETTYYLWHKYGSFLSKQYWKKKIFWSDGYFACSIGGAYGKRKDFIYEGAGNGTIKSTMSGKRVLGDTLSCDGLLKL